MYLVRFGAGVGVEESQGLMTLAVYETSAKAGRGCESSVTPDPLYIRTSRNN